MKSNDIIPSVRLRSVSGHKLNIQCWRRYFWTFIQNLSTKRVNLNFWYGGVLGDGAESLLLSKKYRKSELDAILDAESDRRLDGKVIRDEDVAEIELQREFIDAFLLGLTKQDFYKSLTLDEHQVYVQYQIADGILFNGTMDGLGHYRKTSSMLEIKTAARTDKNIAPALEFDEQIFGYPFALTKMGRKAPKKCFYLIFKKPSKRIKKGQTIAEFIDEIREDIIKRPEFYFVTHQFNVTKERMESVGRDLEVKTQILQQRYDSMTQAELLDPMNWPKCSKQCTAWGLCSFMELCKHEKCWELYKPMYGMREFLYAEEEEELL